MQSWRSCLCNGVMLMPSNTSMLLSRAVALVAVGALAIALSFAMQVTAAATFGWLDDTDTCTT